MNKENPKRRKSKDNPYTIQKNGDTYTISFMDGQGKQQHFEIDKSLYDAFDRFELDDISILNKFDRHTEHSELTEETLNKRAWDKPASIEESVCAKIANDELHNAIAKLPEVQKRRLILYYFAELTFEQIADAEGCSHPAIIKSVNAALKNLKNFL